MSEGLTPASAKAAGPDQHRAAVRQIDLPAHLVLDRLACTQEAHARPLEAPGDLRFHHHDGTAAVADDAAVEPAQGIGDHRRVDHVLDGDHLAQHGVGVVLSVARGGHLDPGELGAGRPELVHVPHGGHGVLVHHRRPEGILERHVRHAHAVVARGRACGHALGSRAAGQGDQRHVALAGRDRLSGVPDVDDVRRPARLRGVHVAELEPHVVGHGEPAQPGRVARAEVAVDVGLGEPGVLQGTLGDLGVELGQRLVVGLAGRMLVDSSDVGLSLDRHGMILSVPPAPEPPAPRGSTR